MRAQTLPILSILALTSSAIPLNNHGHQHLHNRGEVHIEHVTVTVYPTPHVDYYAPSAAPSSYAAPSAPASSYVPSAPSSAPSSYPSSSGGGDTFEIQVSNQCSSDLNFGIYQVDASFNMNQITAPVNIASGSTGSIAAPFSGIGMRLSGTAGDTASQWNAQALFEFGYSTYAGQDGTAYDLSVMGGDTGVAVYPDNSQCPSKVCTPSDCSASAGWTDPNQVDAGSPADTVCYHGKTNFKVVWCP